MKDVTQRQARIAQTYWFKAVEQYGECHPIERAAYERYDERMTARRLQAERDRLVGVIESRGWVVEFVEWCEDAETPGLLGQRGGCTIYSRKAVKVRTHGMTLEQIVAVLAHELEHVDGAERGTDHEDLDLRCGGRVNGFGDPIGATS